MAMIENGLYPQSRRQEFVALLGTLPEQCPLDAEIEEHFIEEGYVREKISYQASPGVRVPAYVLTPRFVKERCPSLVCVHQHNGEFHLGKSELVGLVGDPDMAFAIELCRRGYITIVPDLEGFEERQATMNELERWKMTTPYLLGEGAYEKFLAMKYLLQGSTLQARYVWDLSRAVDYLCSRSDIDPERIGAIGHSLGGLEVCWLLMFDTRISAGVCACGISTFEAIFRDGVNHNLAAYVPGFLQVGDTDQFIAALAPTPLYIYAGSRDWTLPVDGVRQIARVAGASYALLGADAAFRYEELPYGHNLPPDARMLAYEWLDVWLKRSSVQSTQ